ncbi:hypothetical protein ASF61_07150 [Duganella sp. Leaf126]|nr:hypothetical protein ASF61_07150 [Duganella sp. Leaf126]
MRSGAHGSTALARAREYVKLLARSVIHPHASHVWLGLLNSDPLFHQLVALRPRLVGKVFRPYLSGTLDSSQRAALLVGHYHCILRQGWGPLVVQAAGSGVTLGQVAGKSGAVLRLVLRAVEPMEREGELALQLFHGDALVTTCAFSLIDTGDGIHISVGCLQGPRDGHGGGRAIVREATRALHGMRPKSLLIKLLCAIGQRYRCKGLCLVGNRNRAVQRAIRQGKVHADYDGFWRECGATARPDGDYALPCAPLAAPDLAAIASGKRAAARHRFELLRQITDALCAILHRATQTSQPGQAQQQARHARATEAARQQQRPFTQPGRYASAAIGCRVLIGNRQTAS